MKSINENKWFHFAEIGKTGVTKMKKTNLNNQNVKKWMGMLIACFFLTACGMSSQGVSSNEVSQNITQEKTMAEITDTGEVEFTEELLEKAIFNPGNRYRLAEVMQRAEQGEEITIAYIGGSITAGSLASPQETNCYARKSFAWWQETFPNAAFTYVNAGIGATDSYLGVHRAEEDVISQEPDLVIVEFSVNDYRNHNQESYESLLRKLLTCESEPAVIALLLTMENNNDYGTEHAAVAFKLGVPILDYGVLLSEGDVSWQQVGNADGVHPKNEGHAVIAAVLTGFYRQVYTDMEQILQEEAYVVPESNLTLNRYENARIIYGEELSDSPVNITESEGFITEPVESPLLTEHDGFHTTEGGSMVFTVECRAVGILYMRTTDGTGGQYDVYVDGVLTASMDADFSGGWGNCLEYVECIKTTESAMHTIEIRRQEDSINVALSICGICVAE